MPANNFLSQAAQGNIYWVENETHGRNFPVAFNASVVLLDKNADMMYIKSVDGSGVMTGFRKFELNEIVDYPAGNYVPKEDFEALQAQVDELKAELAKQPKYNNYRNNNRREHNNG